MQPQSSFVAPSLVLVGLATICFEYAGIFYNASASPPQAKKKATAINGRGIHGAGGGMVRTRPPQDLSC